MKSIDDIRRENLQLLRTEYGSQKALADALERDEAQVSQWALGLKNSGTGKPRGMRTVTARYIEKQCNKPDGWLDTDHSASNASVAPDLRAPNRIPVVGHVKGGDDGYLDEMQFPVGHGEGYVEYWTRDSSAYALRVRGDSMHPRYRAGEFVVVTPLQEAQPGQDVVVKLTSGKKLLKQLNWIRAGEIQLLSINNHYGPMTLLLREVESIQRVAGSVPPDAFIEP